MGYLIDIGVLMVLMSVIGVVGGGMIVLKNWLFCHTSDTTTVYIGCLIDIVFSMVLW